MRARGVYRTRLVRSSQSLLVHSEVPLSHSGPAKFARLVANIAPSLHTLRTQPANGVFLYRLMFAVRFAEFHQRRINGDIHDAALDVVSILRDDIAPKAWWAVVLYDAVELLQNSELIFLSLSMKCNIWRCIR